MTLPTNKACEMERWADIQHDDAAIVACGERWKAVAAIIGCRLHGFNDGFTASFTTPDGNVIEVGAKFRETITALRIPAPPVTREAVLEEAARVAEYRGPFGDASYNHATTIAAAIRALKSEPVVDQEGEAAK